MRRIGVANSILLTFIGSPVIYYGDEIGMGDNIWLEDRDGVRTPMQWDDGYNAGFSTAPTEDLTDPLIEGEVYGYQRVNVAAQRADPDSLLNRMWELLHVRKEYPVFGRGSLRLLGSTGSLSCHAERGEESVLAYLRVLADQVMVVVNNLSSEPQTVTLTLEDYVGYVPVDVLTDRQLPAIKEGPYPLNLEGYGYQWLHLKPSAASSNG
jgi:maltose alpha-D-glucosyltransferase/alpha-amylase